MREPHSNPSKDGEKGPPVPASSPGSKAPPLRVAAENPTLETPARRAEKAAVSVSAHQHLIKRQAAVLQLIAEFIDQDDLHTSLRALAGELQNRFRCERVAIGRFDASAKRSVDREQPMAAAPAPDKSAYDLAAQLCDPELTPAAAATRREMARRVEDAITRLGEQDCEIIMMRHYEQLSNQEIAEALELSEPAASMRYLRAVRRLRALLMEEAE